MTAAVVFEYGPAERYAEAVRAMVVTMTPHQLQEIVDLSEVEFKKDAEYLPNWREQAATLIIGAAKDGEEWALLFGGDA